MLAVHRVIDGGLSYISWFTHESMLSFIERQLISISVLPGWSHCCYDGIIVAKAMYEWLRNGIPKQVIVTYLVYAAAVLVDLTVPA